MKTIKLECLLMGNNEIIFLGRSLGFVKDDELEKFARDTDKDKDTQIAHLRLQLKAEKAQSSWLDALANQMRDYANRSNLSDSETECEQQVEEEVEELAEEYQAVRKELREFEKNNNC